MKLKKKIEKVKKFILNNQTVYCHIGDVIYHDNEQICQLAENYFGTFYIIDSKIILQSFFGEIVYNENVYKGFFNVNNFSDFSFCDSIDNHVKVVKEDKLISTNIEGYFLVINSICFKYNDLSISSYNYSNFEIIWYFSLSQLPPIPHKEFMNPDAPWEIKKFIGVLENKLWVAMNHRSIIALDIATGELVHNISEIPGFDMEWIHHSIPNTECIQIVPDSSLLMGFADDLIWLINAATGEISIKRYTQLFEENRIKKFRNEFIIDDDLLFFLSDTDPKIGCFNWKTEQLVWQYAFEKTEKGEYPLLTEIQGNRHKLGVKDLANNVYIFEQE